MNTKVEGGAVIDKNKVEVKLPAIEKFSEPMTKLIEAVSDAVGNIFDPESIKARADAKAVASITRTKAQIQAMELKDRAKERARTREERRQKNIESIAGKALIALPADVNSSKPEEDWVHQFLEHAQDIGNDDMQTVWAKLLAGEVSKPGTYSLLTMATLKNLTRHEAELFTKYCRLLWISRETFLPIVDSLHGDLDRQFDEEFREIVGVSYVECQRLQDHGLINFDGLRLPKDGETHPISYFGIEFWLKPQFDLEVRQTLTMAGEQLAPISGAKPDILYMGFVLKNYNHLFAHPFSDEEFEKFRQEHSKK